MSKSLSESCEKAVAVLLVAGCALAAMTTRDAVAVAEQRIDERAWQIEQLRAMQGAGPVVAPTPLELDSLIPCAQVRWRRVAGTAYLHLQPSEGP